MSDTVKQRTIFITRHGESEFNRQGRIGGNADLSPNGHRYAEELAKHFVSLGTPNLKVWTSTYIRTKNTAVHLKAEVLEHRNDLDELNVGICDGMTYEEVAAKYPEEFLKRDQDKFRYRYPKGESYEDVCKRLKVPMDELKSMDNVLLICHQAVARCFLSLWLGKKEDDMPYLSVPLHTLFKLSFENDKLVDVSTTHVPIPAIDTLRLKPQVSQSTEFQYFFFIQMFVPFSLLEYLRRTVNCRCLVYSSTT